MHLKIPKINIHSFWTYQIIGWSIFLIIEVIHVVTTPLAHYQKIIYECIETITGFLLTSILRYYYKKIKYQETSIFKLILKISISSLVITIPWLYLIGIARRFFYQSGLLTVLNNFGAILAWIDVLFPIIFSWSALYFGIKFWLEWDIQKNKISEANSLAEETRLEMLRYQLNPHFLFNALNSIKATINENDHNSKSIITELSEFLRYSLVNKDNKEVPLKVEIDAIKHYLCIEKKRFEEKLNVLYDINPNVEDYPVLSFILHPIVENAVKYGMKTSSIPIDVKIKADEITNGIRIIVQNSGFWVEPNGNQGIPYGTGTGLNNVMSRLECRFPKKYKFDHYQENGNVIVLIELWNNDH